MTTRLVEEASDHTTGTELDPDCRIPGPTAAYLGQGARVPGRTPVDGRDVAHVELEIHWVESIKRHERKSQHFRSATRVG